MRPRSTDRAIGSFWLATALLIAAGPATARAQNYGTAPTIAASAAASAAAGGATTAAQATPEAKPTFEIYGFAMLDIGQDHGARMNPNWSDTLRLTKLPSFDKQYGEEGNTFAGVRQSRFGVKSSTPTPYEGVTLKTVFEFELFGTGVDEGQTTFRLRHAYGELGHFLAGQTWSPFMDPDVFPNTVEYWGPTGMVLFRNVQFRYTAVDNGRHQVMFALERPGASGDQGIYNDRVELDGISSRTPSPDISGAYKYSGGWGHARVGRHVPQDRLGRRPRRRARPVGRRRGLGRESEQHLEAGERLHHPPPVRVRRRHPELHERLADRHRDRRQAAEPHAALRRRADSDHRPGRLHRPLVEREVHALVRLFQPVQRQHRWARRRTAFKDGHYVSGNLLYYPVPGVMVGGELQWGRRVNFSDGFEADGVKAQFAFKYNFSWKLGG